MDRIPSSSRPKSPQQGPSGGRGFSDGNNGNSNERSFEESWATITPGDLISAVARRLPSVLVTSVIVTLLFGALLLAWPNQYASDGMFYVRLGRGAVSVDPTTEPKRSVSLMESRSSEVNSISQMLNSREIADRVVKTVGAREINYPRNWIERLANSTTSWSSEDGENDERIKYEQQIAHEEAVKRIFKSVTITVPKDSYTISVVAKGSDPVLSQKIVQAIMDEYGAYHVEAHKSNGSLGFFEDQTSESEAAALLARKNLQMARKEMGWMSTESAEKSLRDRMTELNLALDQAESGFAEASSEAKVLGEQLATVEEWVPMEVTSVANAAADGMRTELIGTALQDGEKLSKVTPNHPRYKILQSKINSGVEMVESVGEDRQQQTEALNPIRIQLQTDYQTALAKAAGMESRRDALKRSLAMAKQDLERLNEDAIKLTQLTWTADIAETNYLNHAQSLESSRVMSELDKQNMSDVSIIQNASLNLKKVGPPRMILLLLGSLLGVCLGALQALLRHQPHARVAEERLSPEPETNHRPAGETVQHDPVTNYVPKPKRAVTQDESPVTETVPISSDGDAKPESWVSVPR